MVEKITVPELETIFYALIESAETGKLVHIGDHFTVKHTFWGEADMDYTDRCADESFDTFGITIMCCEDEEECAWTCADILLERFNKWYGRQPNPVETVAEVTRWEQAEPFVMDLDEREEAVYDNCCDYLYYGESFASLIERGHNYEVPVERTKELWQLAFWFMAEGCMAENAWLTSGSAKYAA